MHRPISDAATALVLLMLASPPALGQGVITQWNFNGASPSTVPSIGSGSAVLIGGTSAVYSSGTASGGSTDTVATNNSAWNTQNYPSANSGSGTAGVQFDVSTIGLSSIVVRYDSRFNGNASRFTRVEYTTDGGSNWTASGTYEAGIGGGQWYNNRAIDLSGVAAANNNSQFGFRVVTIFDPNGSNYVAATPGTTYDTIGTIRYDAVTISSAWMWTGGSGTGLDVGANFSSATAPGTTGTVSFGNSANTTITAATGGTTLDQIIIRPAANAYLFSGSEILTLNAGLVNNSAQNQSFASPVTFGNQNQILSSSQITFSGLVRFRTALVLSGTGMTTFNGSVQFVSGTSATLRVGTGSALAGVGTIGTTSALIGVEVFPGGAIRAGDPNGSSVERTGTLTVCGNVTINSNATTNGIFRVEANRTGVNAAVSSILSVEAGGFLNLNPGAGNRFTIDVVNSANSLHFGETYVIQLAGVGGGALLKLNGQVIGGNATVESSNYILTSSFADFQGVSLTTNVTGTALFLTFTPVPEPEIALGIATGALGLFAFFRQRIELAFRYLCGTGSR